MRNDTILITGGSGFLGVSLTEELFRTAPAARVVLSDIVRSPRIERVAKKVEFVSADLSDAEACSRIVTPEVRTIYHLASLVSGGAEKDFEAGMRANVHATLNLLEACRLRGRCPRFVFASSIATFGGAAMPDTVDDWTHQHPQNSYGVAKVIGEQLLNDYSRKGFIDGRGVRLAAIIVRDEPNTAASGYASSLIREPVSGNPYVCPVATTTRLPVLSIQRCVETLLALAALPQEALGDYRTVNSPSISPSAREIADAVERCGLSGAGRISFEPDPQVERIIRSWPKIFVSKRAEALGLRPDPSIGDIVRRYVEAVRAGHGHRGAFRP